MPARYPGVMGADLPRPPPPGGREAGYGASAPVGQLLRDCLGVDGAWILARLLDLPPPAGLEPEPQLLAVDLGMELDRQMPADRERLHADLVARQNRRVPWRLAPVAVELQPGAGRDQGLLDRGDHRPADLLARGRDDLAAEGRAQRLR